MIHVQRTGMALLPTDGCKGVQGPVRADGTQAAEVKAWQQQRSAEAALSAAEAAVKSGLQVGYSPS